VIKFIIVDDNKDELAHIKSLLNEVVKDDKEILAFSKVGPELNDVINDTDTRKVYILDIEIGTNVSGINIAKKIRDIDWESEIIFITNHDKMFESAHRTIYEVFDFIEKFVALNYRVNVESIDINSPKGNYKITFSDDMSEENIEEKNVMKDNRKGFINGQELDNDSFSEFYELLIGITFDNIDKNYSVSGEPVVSIKYNLKDGSYQNINFYEYDNSFYLADNGKLDKLVVHKHNVDIMLDKAKQLLES